MHGIATGKVAWVAILILKVVRCITIASYVRIPPWVKLDDSSSYVLYGCIKSSRSFLVKGVPIFTVGSLNLVKGVPIFTVGSLNLP